MSGVRITHDSTASVRASIRALLKKEILVGIPAEDAERYQPGAGSAQVNNAMIGYWMEYGIPSRNVPARPSLIPGIQSVINPVADQLAGAARAAVTRDADGAENRLHAAGLIASAGVKNYINAGVGPALSEYTLRKRAARGGGSTIAAAAQEELDNRANVPGYAPSLDLAKPLVDTAQFRNAITYVIKAR